MINCSTMTLSVKEVRRLTLSQQGLLQQHSFGRGIDAVARAIDRLHYVQIDTISVVERAHHHVLHSRVANFQPELLTQLSGQNQKIFEYWFHAAAFMPMEDYRYSLPVKRGYADRKLLEKKRRNEIIRRITTEGPLQSRDFAAPKGHKSGGWWSWKPAKAALEYLFLSGELMVSERRGFQKVYDLTENVLPVDVDTSLPNESELGHYYVQRMLSALGPAQARDIAFPRTTVKRFSKIDIQVGIVKALNELLEEGQVYQFILNDSTYYCLSSQIEKSAQRLGRKRIHLLSPFDNVLINRRRLLELFDFDYQLECYVPSEKRKFGYFCLPVLYGDCFIGRIDCKADRACDTLQIKNLWLEKNTVVDSNLEKAFEQAIRRYMNSLACAKLQLPARNSNPIIRFLRSQYKHWQ